MTRIAQQQKKVVSGCGREGQQRYGQKEGELSEADERYGTQLLGGKHGERFLSGQKHSRPQRINTAEAVIRVLRRGVHGERTREGKVRLSRGKIWSRFRRRTLTPLAAKLLARV